MKAKLNAKIADRLDKLEAYLDKAGDSFNLDWLDGHLRIVDARHRDAENSRRDIDTKLRLTQAVEEMSAEGKDKLLRLTK
jgi:hypothetical protein